MLRAVLPIFVTQLLLGCGDDGVEPVISIVPPDYAATYQEVRDCRFSLDHDLTRMRVLAAPEALAFYTDRNAPFPVGAIVLKEQYDSADTNCAGPILHYTVMQKLPTGTDPAGLDWLWQKADVDFHVMETDLKRCTSCHTNCGKPPGGHDGTCAEP